MEIDKTQKLPRDGSSSEERKMAAHFFFLFSVLTFLWALKKKPRQLGFSLKITPLLCLVVKGARSSSHSPPFFSTQDRKMISHFFSTKQRN